jgi:subtilisin-like proprotein convertase family protein
MRRFYCLISITALTVVIAGALPAGAAAPASPPNCQSPSTSSPANNTAVPIPTGPSVVTSTIDVSGAGPYLLDVNALTDISHTFSADLDVTLTSPAGTVVTLTTDNGSGSDDVFRGTTWDDSANPAGQVPYTTNDGLATDQTYANLTTATPLVPEEAMGAFIGENPNGTWTLTVSDDLAGDGGTLNSWGLDLKTGSCPAPVPTLSIADAKAKEGDSHATKVKIPVTLSAASTSEVDVDFATVKGSAHPGSDFKKAAGRLSFAPGATKSFIKVKVLGDTKHEKTEKFSVALSNASNATIADGSGLVKIKKSD